MSRHPSKLQLSGWILTGLAIVAMCIATIQDHRVAFGYFAAFALVGVFPNEERVPPTFVRLSLAAFFLASLAMLAAVEFDLLSAKLRVVARCGYVIALAAYLELRIVDHLSAEIISGK